MFSVPLLSSVLKKIPGRVMMAAGQTSAPSWPGPEGKVTGKHDALPGGLLTSASSGNSSHPAGTHGPARFKSSYSKSFPREALT